MINEKNTAPKKFYCLHCNVELLNDQESFCCKGCQTAFDIINKNGFINFYSSRLLATDSSSLKPDNNLNFSPQEFINFDPQTMIYSLNLVVHGLHCGACVWLIENLLSRQEDVVKSRVNLTLKTLEIQWRGTPEYGNDLTGLIEKIGYKLLPADANAVAEFEKRFDIGDLKLKDYPEFKNYAKVKFEDELEGFIASETSTHPGGAPHSLTDNFNNKLLTYL